MNYRVNTIYTDSPIHQHNFHEIIVYIKGDGILYTEGKEHTVGPGNITLVPPMAKHGSVFTTETERIYINGDFNHMFSFTEPVVIADSQKGEGTALAKMIYDNRYKNSEYVSALCNAFAHFLLQNLKTDDSIGMAVNEVINQITENFFDCNINLQTILVKSGYAEDYIRARFKRFTGKTPIEFLTHVRINHACYLIDTYKASLSLFEIAEKCGYTDYIYFSRKFKQLIGISPQKYKVSN